MRAFLSVLSAIFALGAFLSVTWVGCSAFLKNNDAYTRGLQTALADTTVGAALGAPVEESWFINGAIESDASGTRGAWSTRLRGTRASGTLDIAGLKRGDRWGVTGMTLRADGALYGYVPGQGFAPVNGDTRPDFDILPD